MSEDKTVVTLAFIKVCSIVSEAALSDLSDISLHNMKGGVAK